MMQAGVKVTITCTATAVTAIRRAEALPQGATAQGDLLDMADFRPTPAGRLKSFTALGGVTLRAMAPKWPLNPIRARAEAPQGSIVLTKTGGSPDGSWATIGLRPTFDWCVVLPSGVTLGTEPTELNGTFVAFLPNGGDIAANVRKVSQSCTPADLDRLRAIYAQPAPDATTSKEDTGKEDRTSSVTPPPPRPPNLGAPGGPPPPPRSGPPGGPPPQIRPPQPR